ncbi:hypothetical protein STPH2_5098 [Streptomyces sp. KO7888]|nr:hypothetical protein [Streptomyces sp. KO7888]
MQHEPSGRTQQRRLEQTRWKRPWGSRLPHLTFDRTIDTGPNAEDERTTLAIPATGRGVPVTDVVVTSCISQNQASVFDFCEERNQKATSYHAFLLLACDSCETTPVCLLRRTSSTNTPALLPRPISLTPPVRSSTSLVTDSGRGERLRLLRHLRRASRPSDHPTLRRSAAVTEILAPSAHTAPVDLRFGPTQFTGSNKGPPTAAGISCANGWDRYPSPSSGTTH